MISKPTSKCTTMSPSDISTDGIALDRGGAVGHLVPHRPVVAAHGPVVLQGPGTWKRVWMTLIVAPRLARCMTPLLRLA